MFDTHEVLELRIRVKELDRAITAAMKKNDYTKAKTLTEEQEGLIQRLVALGERTSD